MEENLRIVQYEHEKVKTEKGFLEKELKETMKKLQEALQVNSEEDGQKRMEHAQQSYTELLTRKLKLQREVWYVELA